MTIDLVLAVLAVVLAVSTIAAVAAAVDRTARATAWRQIALERRWNHEQRTHGS